MRLVSCVGSSMDCQSAALYKSLVTRFVIASIGALVGMYAIMTLEIRLAIETLARKINKLGSFIQTDIGSKDQGGLEIQLPWNNLDAIRIGRDEQPSLQQKQHPWYLA